MNAIHSILVVVDPTAEVHSAVAKGALLAEAFRARLELYICDTKAARAARFAAHVSQSPKEPFVSDMKAVLEKLAGPLRARGLDVTTETECADPLHAALIQRTKHTSADLVVKDTHHHSLARRTFLTNTDWELIRNCAVPLLLTRTAAWTAHPRIVAAIDPGHANDKPFLLDHRILEHAAALARHLGGELHAAHAYLPLSIVAEATIASPPMVMAVPPEILAAEERDKLKEVSGPGLRLWHRAVACSRECRRSRRTSAAFCDIVARRHRDHGRNLALGTQAYRPWQHGRGRPRTLALRCARGQAARLRGRSAVLSNRIYFKISKIEKNFDGIVRDFNCRSRGLFGSRHLRGRRTAGSVP